MQANKRSGFAILIALCIYLLGACGYKGPLYLPDEQPAATPATGQDAETNESEDDTHEHG